VPHRNYEIICEDINGALALHAEMIHTDDWRATSPEYSGMFKSGRAEIITLIADTMGRGKIYRIKTPTNYLTIDRCLNTWIDNKYLDPAVYLPKIVPDEYIDLS